MRKLGKNKCLRERAVNIFIMLELKASFVSLICNNNTIITNTYEALFVYQALHFSNCFTWKSSVNSLNCSTCGID